LPPANNYPDLVAGVISHAALDVGSAISTLA